MLGYSGDWESAIRTAGRAALVVVLDVTLTDAEASVVAGAGAVVVLGTTASQVIGVADVVVPVTNTAEEQGTFVNRDGRVQRYMQARTAPGMGRPAWWVAAEVRDAAAATPEEAFAAVAATVPEFAGLSYSDMGLTGRPIRRAVPAAAGV
jgi:predicted molibdopterin-dependent oxidoreductase YjgC